MLLRAFGMLYRKRLIAATANVVLLPAIFVFVAANLCDCDRDTTTSLLKILLGSFSFVSLILGFIFGVSVAVQAPGVPNQSRFLLTRPIPLSVMQFYPLAIATGVILALPALGWMVVLGVLDLVHASTLGTLMTTAATDSRIAALGAHPSFLAMLGAMQVGRRYVAAVSVGVAIFTFFAMARWCVASTNKRLRQIGLFSMLPLPVFLLPLNFLFRSSLSQVILLAQLRHGSPDYVPTNLGIALHFIFGVACLCAQYAVMRDVEL